MHPEAPKETVTVQVRQPEELPEQVTGQIVTKMENGIDEFEIHIEPENLGKIAVKISYQQGEANVSLICSERDLRRDRTQFRGKYDCDRRKAGE